MELKSTGRVDGRVIAAKVGMLMLTVALLFCPNMSMAEEKIPFEDMMVNALLNKKIQKELELGPEQRKELKTVLDDILKQHKEMARKVNELKKTGLPKEEFETQQEELRTEFLKKKSKTQSSVTKILVPHQLDRLRQYAARTMIQVKLKSKEAKVGILTEEVQRYLEIDPKQADEILEKSKEIQKKLREDIKELNRKAEEDLLKTLRKDQREKYKELIGQPIK